MDAIHEKALERIRQLQEQDEMGKAARLERLLARADEVLGDFEAWQQ